MSFIRAKEIPPRSGNWYDYEVKSVNENGKIRQKHIRYIGKHGTSVGVLAGGHSAPINVKDTIAVSPSPAKPKTACKFCGGQNTRKYGLYKGVQNYYCDDCRTKFTGTDALPHGRVSPAFIASALNQFYNGSSFHDIESDIDQRTNEGISHTAVIKWINKYTVDAIKATKDLHPKVGDTWIADETFVRVDKSKTQVKNPYWHERKEKWVVFWDIIDAKTRFLLASHLATTRTAQDAKQLLDSAYKRAGKMPKVVVTDKLKAYIDGVKQAYGSRTKHIQGSPFGVKNDSNLIERFQGSLRERTKVMRAQKNKATLQRFTDGWLVHYNFFRPHMSLNNRPPAEVAGLKYNKRTWADIVGVEKEPIAKPLT
ncbi:MAG: DDE-type integrase/transposase/recombinase [Chloroflexota bacterium]